MSWPKEARTYTPVLIRHNVYMKIVSNTYRHYITYVKNIDCKRAFCLVVNLLYFDLCLHRPVNHEPWTNGLLKDTILFLNEIFYACKNANQYNNLIKAFNRLWAKVVYMSVQLFGEHNGGEKNEFCCHAFNYGLRTA